MNIGKKLRALRLGMNLTQQELANQLNLTKGYISQLENNLTSPSLSTLFQILEALDSSSHEFFSQEQSQVIVYKKEDYKAFSEVILKYKTFSLISEQHAFYMSPIIIEIEPGGQSQIDDAHPGEEFGFVLEGQITLVFNQKRYIIRKGESFYYQATKEHFLINNAQVSAKVLWITSPPKFNGGKNI